MIETAIVMMDQINGRRHVRIGNVVKTDGNVMIVYSASMLHLCVMMKLTAMIDQMSGPRPVRHGTALKTCGNVLMACCVSLAHGCVMEVMIVLMILMSLLRPLAALKASGNVTIILSASNNPNFVMDTMCVLTDQMSGWRLASGTAVNLIGDVPTNKSVSIQGTCVTPCMEMIAVMDQMSGRKPVRIGTALKATGNVMMIHGVSLTPGYVMGMNNAVTDQMSGTSFVRT